MIDDYIRHEVWPMEETEHGLMPTGGPIERYYPGRLPLRRPRLARPARRQPRASLHRRPHPVPVVQRPGHVRGIRCNVCGTPMEEP